MRTLYTDIYCDITLIANDTNQELVIIDNKNYKVLNTLPYDCSTDKDLLLTLFNSAVRNWFGNDLDLFILTQSVNRFKKHYLSTL